MVLSWLQHAYSCPLCFRQAILTRKVGHTDLVFDTQSGFIRHSAHARLQVSACSGCHVFHPGLVNIQTHIQTDTDTHRQHFDQLTSIPKAQPAELKMGWADPREIFPVDANSWWEHTLIAHLVHLAICSIADYFNQIKYARWILVHNNIHINMYIYNVPILGLVLCVCVFLTMANMFTFVHNRFSICLLCIFSWFL